jgi:ubiquinone/menaquinone biosynthesis C-methylase UbiE
MYGKFARIYDKVMRGVDYPTWADYVMNLSARFGFESSRICDLACGTGSLALELADRGCEVTGVDGSADMLAQARVKAEVAGHEDIVFEQGDLRSFNLEKKFPLVTCLYDSVNYLTSEEDVQSCFRQACGHVLPGGGFIFDITTEFNIIANFADYTFAENFDDFSYIWENRYDLVNKLIVSDVTIFHKDEDRFYKVTETHRQKIYSTGRMEELAKEAGFEILGAFDGFTLDSPGPRVERVHFVCRRPLKPRKKQLA